MYQMRTVRLSIFLLWGVLTSVSLYIRPLFPVDETRYAAVAWEMWLRDDFLVPYLNGETYSHKPPLLFWLMQLSWWLFGVNDWSLRLISPLFSLATVCLSGAVARALWPERKQTEALTPLLLLGSFFWMIYSTLTMFDMMLAFFALLAIYSLLRLVASGLSLRYWALLGIAIGGGILSKGPVILLHILPVALLSPWWLKTACFCWKHWYLGLIAAVLMGAVIALCWAIPAGIAGGEAYRDAIFLGQTSGRLVNSFAHQSPWWWYLEILPLLLLPWLLWRPLWAGFRKLTYQDSGIRFCLAWAIPVFIAFSLVSGKRIHYLLPLVPALILIVARAADEVTDTERWERTHIAVMAVFGLLGTALILLPWLNGVYQWQAELSLLSPLWGSLLLIVAVIFGVTRIRGAQNSALTICAASIVALITVSGGFFDVKSDRFDTKPAARTIAALMDENKAIAFYGDKYHGQYHFAGRLQHAMTHVSNFTDLYDWAKLHQTGYIIVTYKDSEPLPLSLVSYYYPFKSQNIGLLSSRVLLANTAAVPFFASAELSRILDDVETSD
jgi:4-amino-4-deoxy-L-arabinose transferase-like glycosyltransferase